MPNFHIEGFVDTEKSWKQTIVENIDSGKVLPLISNAICNNLIFGSHEDLIKGLATSIGYPLDDKSNLAQMTQFHSVMSKADPNIKADYLHIRKLYLKFLERVLSSNADPELLEALQEEVNLHTLALSNKAERLNCPSFDTTNPLVRLAQFPLPIFLTTGYHSLLEIALEKEGKKPRTEVCCWNDLLQNIPSVFDPNENYEPTPQEPLVYHLHGCDARPESLVLTEDDHLDFMATILKNKETIPLRVREALASSSLVLLGYGLRDWDFKVIFRSIIKPGNKELRLKSVAIQLSPDNEHERHYLENYLYQEAEFEVYWGEAHEFIQELWEDWAKQE